MYIIDYLSKNKILSVLDEKTAFEFYFGTKIDLRRNKYLNPFRSDKHIGSCHFNYWKGVLYFFDKSTNEKYNLFTFVSKKYNCTYYQALYIINKDFNLCLKVDRYRLGNYQHIPFSIQKIVKPSFNKSISEPVEFKVETSDFTEEDLLYWLQYNITLEDLIKFDIKSVSKYYINTSLNQWKLVYSRSKNKDICFLYNCVIINEKGQQEIKVKIYRPLTDKKDKWRTNYNVLCLQNYNELPKNYLSISSKSYVFIVSSLKDGICLSKMGHYFVVPSSESVPIDKLFIKKLKERFEERLFILYDNDDAGQINSIKHSNLYNIPFLSLEKINRNNSEFNNKDIADYVKSFGYNFTENLIYKQIQKYQNVKRNYKTHQ